MKQGILRKPFIFNEQIDTSFLFGMYEDDFAYIEQVFYGTLVELHATIPKCESSYQSADLVSLKQVIHKIKPSFGFTGLLKIQALLQQFEDACLAYESIEALHVFYHEVIGSIHAGKEIIETDYNKLKDYNGSKV